MHNTRQGRVSLFCTSSGGCRFHCCVGCTQISKWFMASRDPVTGEYPDLPSEELGGSKDILEAPLPAALPEPVAKPPKKTAAKKKPPAPDGEAPLPPPPQPAKAGGKKRKGTERS